MAPGSSPSPHGRLERAVAVGSMLAAVALAVTFTGAMLARVAEHPGLPREVGPPPAWFAGGAADGSSAVTSAGAGEASPLAEPSPAAAPAGAEAEYVEVAGREVRIALKEYELVPARIRVQPGQLAITFVLHNEGRFAHNFHVEGPGVEVTASKFGPGNTVRLEVTVQEGEYRISCPLSNHDQRGMHGTLLVVPERTGG